MINDFEARHVIEALRSGIPSRAVGQYFSEARPGMMKKISDKLDRVRETGPVRSIRQPGTVPVLRSSSVMREHCAMWLHCCIPVWSW